MALPLPTPLPTLPPRWSPKEDEFAGLEELDRSELDDAPDTEREPTLPALEWEDDSESGIKRRG